MELSITIIAVVAAIAAIYFLSKKGSKAKNHQGGGSGSFEPKKTKKRDTL